ncbi:MAG: GTPase HflX [Candidatus Delongbacteria bacterium]|nr:GTPase HflX [Candidatus Delongbacteria bacterium]MBN2836715.1 GTPase HflX [Candidatus Delongbacteria bacterium]
MKDNDRQKVCLVSICLPDQNIDDINRSLDELTRLADTAELSVVERFIQNRKSPDIATYVGKGFLEQIKSYMDANDIELILFDDELSPAQARNIYRNFGIDTIDRTELILEIFRIHAKTKEARLQVRLANLNYQLPRLKKLWSHLDRERGTSSGGSSGSKGTSRGMGEKQIEIDKREIKAEIKKISDNLDKIVKQRTTQRKRRRFYSKVCLIGYTNAGKSSVFNYLTDAGVLSEDKLFATLDSTARKYKINPVKEIILSDTVGFISRLPHNLVASFRATLMDAVDAELLLHIVDISDDNCENHMGSVKNVLKEIHLENKAQVVVFNKVDLLPEMRLRESILKSKYNRAFFVSAFTGENMDSLMERVRDLLEEHNVKCFFIPFENHNQSTKIFNVSEVLVHKHLENGTYMEVIISDKNADEFSAFSCEQLNFTDDILTDTQ